MNSFPATSSISVIYWVNFSVIFLNESLALNMTDCLRVHGSVTSRNWGNSRVRVFVGVNNWSRPGCKTREAWQKRRAARQFPCWSIKYWICRQCLSCYRNKDVRRMTSNDSQRLNKNYVSMNLSMKFFLFEQLMIWEIEGKSMGGYREGWSVVRAYGTVFSKHNVLIHIANYMFMNERKRLFSD